MASAYNEQEEDQARHGGGDHLQLREWFTAVDIDSSGEISAEELQEALMNGDWSPFEMKTVKKIMLIFDMDRSGTIGYSEFVRLWQYVKNWQILFDQYDKDKSGTIDRAELEHALKELGYDLRPNVVRLLLAKHAPVSKKSKPDVPSINFDRFLRVCSKMKTISQSFDLLDVEKKGSVLIDFDTFVSVSLSVA